MQLFFPELSEEQLVILGFGNRAELSLAQWLVCMQGSGACSCREQERAT